MDLEIIHNPAAGQRGQRLFQAVLARLAAADCRISVHHTEGPGHASRLAEAAAAKGPDRLVVAGGDGTVNEVVNGLSGTNVPPVAIIPMGTANVLAAEIGLAIQTDGIVDTIRHGDALPITLGVIGDRRFVLMAGVGFDAQVVAGVDTALKRKVGKLAYGVSFLNQLHRFQFPKYGVTVDGVRSEGASVIVTNARRYAGSHVIAPEADLRHPSFQVCRFLSHGRWPAIREGAALFMNRLRTGPHFAIASGQRIVIDGPAGDPVQADGDIVATLPVEIAALPAALRLVYPPNAE